MRPRASRPRTILIGLTVCGALGFAACGSDSDSDGSSSGGGNSTEAFCDELNALAEVDADTTEEEDLATLRAIADAAPDEVADDMETLVDAFEQLSAVDPETASEEELAGFEELVGELDAASTNIEEFATENCPDLPADFFDEG